MSDTPAVEIRDLSTANHTNRVTMYSLLLADELHVAEPERALLQLGTRAVPGVCDALLAAIDAQPYDAAYEKLVHDVLVELLPEWAGYTADAPVTDRRAAVEAARRLAAAGPHPPHTPE